MEIGVWRKIMLKEWCIKFIVSRSVVGEARKALKFDVTSIPTSRDALCHGTISRFWPQKSLTRKSIKICSISHCSAAISPPGNQSAMRNTMTLAMPSIASLSPSFAASAVSPLLNRDCGSLFEVRSVMGKFYQEGIWLQALKATLTWGTCIPGVSPGGGGAPRRGVLF